MRGATGQLPGPANVGPCLQNAITDEKEASTHGSIFCSLAYSVVASFHSLLRVFGVSWAVC